MQHAHVRRGILARLSERQLHIRTSATINKNKELIYILDTTSLLQERDGWGKKVGTVISKGHVTMSQIICSNLPS